MILWNVNPFSQMQLINANQLNGFSFKKFAYAYESFSESVIGLLFNTKFICLIEIIIPSVNGVHDIQM